MSQPQDVQKYEAQPVAQAERSFGEKPLRYSTVVSGQTLNCHEDFKRRLQDQVTGLQEVSGREECDVILLFCPVVSRAATDIKAALEKLHNISDSTPVVLVVLHHTYDPYSILPDSSRSVIRENILTVDCVFHEDRGLLHCSKNSDAVKHIEKWMKSEINKDGSQPQDMQKDARPEVQAEPATSLHSSKNNDAVKHPEEMKHEINKDGSQPQDMQKDARPEVQAEPATSLHSSKNNDAVKHPEEMKHENSPCNIL
ncbi:hypothetical protein AOLI_G00269930 [Acnodon oligacanthus]